MVRERGSLVRGNLHRERGARFKKRGSSRSGQTLPKEASFYIFCVFADHTLITEAMVVMVAGKMAAGAKIQKSGQLSLPSRDWSSWNSKSTKMIPSLQKLFKPHNDFDNCQKVGPGCWITGSDHQTPLLSPHPFLSTSTRDGTLFHNHVKIQASDLKGKYSVNCPFPTELHP